MIFYINYIFTAIVSNFALLESRDALRSKSKNSQTKQGNLERD